MSKTLVFSVTLHLMEWVSHLRAVTPNQMALPTAPFAKSVFSYIFYYLYLLNIFLISYFILCAVDFLLI